MITQANQTGFSSVPQVLSLLAICLTMRGPLPEVFRMFFLSYDSSLNSKAMYHSELLVPETCHSVLSGAGQCWRFDFVFGRCSAVLECMSHTTFFVPHSSPSGNGSYSHDILCALMCVSQDEVEIQQPDESNPYEEVYKDSSTFLKVGKLAVSVFYTLYLFLNFMSPSCLTNNVLKYF